MVYTLNFSEKEINEILAALAERPYKDVINLINNIYSQVETAQSKMQAATATATNDKEKKK